jgi:hypothetical protein
MSRFGKLAQAPRSLGRGVWGGTRSLAARLRDSARGESRRRRIVWVAIAALLVLVPLGFNLARAAGFSASLELFPQKVGPYPAVDKPSYYRSFLTDPELGRQMDINARVRPADFRDAAIRPHKSHGTLVLTITADTPEKAQRIVNQLGPQIGGATSRQLARDTDKAIGKLQDRLRTRLSSSERTAARRDLRRLERLQPLPPARLLFGRPAPLPKMDRWADRVVDDLPGDFSGRPSPAAAALAGLLVALILWAICLALLPPAGRRSDALPQPD